MAQSVVHHHGGSHGLHHESEMERLFWVPAGYYKVTTFSYSANEAIQPISKENLSLHVLRGAGGAVKVINVSDTFSRIAAVGHPMQELHDLHHQLCHPGVTRLSHFVCTPSDRSDPYRRRENVPKYSCTLSLPPIALCFIQRKEGLAERSFDSSQGESPVN